MGERKFNHWDAQTGVCGSTRPRRQKHRVVVGQKVWQFGFGDHIVAQHFGFCTKLLQVTVERVNERVVVIENQNFHHDALSLTCA